jgi:sensor domain CHASE-containing protein
MKGATRFAVESLLLFLLSGAILVTVVVTSQQIFTDEKIQYFVIGYVAAIHNDLVRWIWKRLRVEKAEIA